MIRCLAAWVLPIAAPPVRGGWVALDRGRIVAYGRRGDRDGRLEGARDIELGDVALLPGLVNAHTHLELSYLRGRVPRGVSFVSWIRDLMAVRRDYPDPYDPEILDAASAGIAEAVRSGTAVVGDLSNTLATFPRLAESPLASVVFHELIGFNAADPVGTVDRALAAIRGLAGGGTARATLAAHAPYSVAPSLLRAIAGAVERDRLVSSVHLAESADEIEFIATGGGAWKQLLQDVGAWDPHWTVPGVTPVGYLDRHGFLGDRVLAVHGVHATDDDLARLAARRTTLVTCPRSNRYTGAGTAPVGRFYASGVAVSVGTDSLASTPDLNLFFELAEMRALAPDVPASRLLESATRTGARALGFDPEYGTIEPGKRARLLAVAVPAAVDDVEEYLVSGIHPEQLQWIDDFADPQTNR